MMTAFDKRRHNGYTFLQSPVPTQNGRCCDLLDHCAAHVAGERHR
jgi:hypothetical protein